MADAIYQFGYCEKEGNPTGFFKFENSSDHLEN